MWHKICYVSTANPNMDDSETKALLDLVTQKNNLLKVKGILLFLEGNFFQILEGKEKQIKELFETIKNDPRHHNIIKIFSHSIKDQSFEDYRSSFKAIIPPNYKIDLQKFLEEERLLNPTKYDSINYLIKNFLRIN